MPGIGIGIGLPFGGGVNWNSYWAAQALLHYTSRNSLDLLETQSVVPYNGKIMPSCGQIKSGNYIYHAINNFESSDASGYIEVNFYNSGVAGVNYIFSSASESATTRYFRIYLSSSNLYLHVRSNIGTVFENRFYITGGVSVGWHTVRFTSSGGSYSAVVDGGATLTMGNGLTLSAGADDGRWIDLVTLRNNICIGTLKTSAAIYDPPTEVRIGYVDYNNKHKWYLSGVGLYSYDTIGTLHVQWTGTDHKAYDINASTYFLENNWEKWKKAGASDEQVPAVSDTTEIATAGYVKPDYGNYSGSASVINMADCLIDFDYEDNTPETLDILDRSNETYHTAISRASDYYDAANPYRYHISELADPRIYTEFFTVGNAGRFFSKITTQLVSGLYYIKSLESEIIVTKTDKTGAEQYRIMTYCGSDVFAE